MPSRASSPLLWNASLRLRCLNRRTPAASATRSTEGSRSQAQTTRFGRQRQSSRRSEGASRRQPMRIPRSRQLRGSIRLSQALRAKQFLPQALAHLTQVQGSSFVVCRGLELRQFSKSPRSGNAWPNPSLKPSPNSRALGRRSCAVHHQPRRPSARLSGPA